MQWETKKNSTPAQLPLRILSDVAKLILTAMFMTYEDKYQELLYEECESYKMSLIFEYDCEYNPEYNEYDCEYNPEYNEYDCDYIYEDDSDNVYDMNNPDDDLPF